MMSRKTKKQTRIIKDVIVNDNQKSKTSRSISFTLNLKHKCEILVTLIVNMFSSKHNALLHHTQNNSISSIDYISLYIQNYDSLNHISLYCEKYSSFVAKVNDENTIANFNKDDDKRIINRKIDSNKDTINLISERTSIKNQNKESERTFTFNLNKNTIDFDKKRKENHESQREESYESQFDED